MKSECYFSFKLKNKGVLNRFTDSSSLTPEIEGDLDAILGCVFSSVNRIPLQLKRLFSEIKRLCVQRFPDDPNVVFLVHILELSLLLLLLLLTSPFLWLTFLLPLLLQAYKSLLDLTTQNFEIPRTLLQLTSNLEKEKFAQNVLRILEAKGRALDFLLNLIKTDIDSVTESNVLFRVNTVGTKGPPAFRFPSSTNFFLTLPLFSFFFSFRSRR